MLLLFTKNIQIIQIIVAILLMLAILMQNRGSGLSNVFGGASNVYRT
ncbi:MAG: preprotein translocase subunit SecG, partial [Patescibacteria group bacterium]